MSLEVTPEAAEVLQRSLELGGVDPQTGGVRLRVARGLGGGSDVQVELAAEALEGEDTIETSGIRLFVDRELARIFPNAVVAVEPQHEVVVVRPAPQSD